MTWLSERADLNLWEIPVAGVTELIDRGIQDISSLDFLTFDDTGPVSVQTCDSVGSVRDLMIEKEREDEDLIGVERARTESEDAMSREMETSLQERLLEDQARITRFCDEFGRDRQRYFAAAETQVVRLALAIAKRVLTREAAVNPLHLEATVRAALTKVQDGSESVLRVHTADIAEWTRLFAVEGEFHVRILGEDLVARGECMLQTNVGRVDLGVEAQMQEIGRGFEELVQRHSG